MSAVIRTQTGLDVPVKGEVAAHVARYEEAKDTDLLPFRIESAAASAIHIRRSEIELIAPGDFHTHGARGR